MRKYIWVLLIVIAGIMPLWMLHNQPAIEKQKQILPVDLKTCQDNLLKYLKVREDNLATEEINKILAQWPDDICALWGEAEILRRNYKFKESEALLNQILAKSPDHAPSLISLSYIRYYDNKFNEALKILKEVLRQADLERENKALIYMLMGSINAKKAAQGGLLSRVVYGTRILGYFERAVAFAPDLAEAHLGLGTFCLLAPRIAGGDVDRAIEELEWAVRLAPDFATANARLAQAYKKKGMIEKYNFYLTRAKGLDPESEVIREIEGQR